MKCHFEYKGRKYNSISDLYPAVKAEQDTLNSVVMVTENGPVNRSPVAQQAVAKHKGRVATSIDDLKTLDEVHNLTQYKRNKFANEASIKHKLDDPRSIVLDYFIRGNKVSKESVAQEAYGREAVEVARQMKTSRWAVGSDNTIEEAANTIVNDIVSNYGKHHDVGVIRDTIIDVVKAFNNLNDVKDEFIIRYLESEQKLSENNYSAVESPLPYKAFSSVNPITDVDRELAMGNLSGMDFIAGSRLETADGPIIVVANNTIDENYYEFYKEDNPSATTSLSRSKLINLVAYNLQYQYYLSGVMEEFNTPDVVDGDAVSVQIPTTEEALKAIPPNQTGTPFLSATNEQNFLAWGYDPKMNARQNLNRSLFHIIETTQNPTIKLMAKKFFQNIEAFDGMPFMIDNDLMSSGVATSRANETTGIRLNPLKIGTADQYARVLLEEMTHALTRKEARNKNSEVTKRLISLHQMAVAAFGNDRLAYLSNMQKQRITLVAKERAGLELTEDEANELRLIRDELEDADERIVYALSNFDEFIAHIGVSPAFQAFLNSVQETTTQKSLYREFVDIIASLLEKLGIISSNTGILKYAVHDLMNILDDSIKNSNIGRALHAQNTRSKDFVNAKFGLKADNGASIQIANGTEVQNMINDTYSNLIALYDTNTRTIELSYRDEVSAQVLASIDAQVKKGKDDASYSFDFPEFGGPETDSFGEYGNLFDNDNDVDWDYYDSNYDDFGLQLKVYLTNLNDREKSLQRSKDLASDMNTTTLALRNEQALRISEIDKQINEVRSVIRRISDSRSYITPFNNIIDVAYKGMDELAKIDETLKRPMTPSDFVFMLQTVKFWKNAKEAIFIDKNYKDKAVNDLFSEVERAAEDKLNTITPFLDKYVIDQVVKKNTKFNGSIEDLAKEFVDLNKLEGLVNNLGVIDSSLLQAIGKAIKTQNEVRGDEVFNAVKTFEKIAEKAVKVLQGLNKKDPHDIFRQRDNFGRKTKDIVTRFSYAYQKARRGALGFTYNKNSERTNDQAENALAFLYNNTEAIKYSVLFPANETDFDQASYDAEAERLKTLMGDNHYNEWYAKQAKAVVDYKKLRDIKLYELGNKFELASEQEIIDHPEAGRYFNHFIENNSIYGIEKKLANYNKGIKHFTLASGYDVFKYIVDVPKQTFQNGTEETSSYDINYQTIEKNPEILGYYQAIYKALDDIGKIIPFETGDKISKNGLPEFKLQMFDLFMSNNTKAGMDAFVDQMYDMVRTEKAGKKNVKIDVITGKKKRKIPTGLYSSNSKIREELELRQLQYRNENGTTPTEEMIEDWKSEITETYANDMQGDLSKIIPMYITLGLAYKHKAMIEDNFIIAREVFNNMKEYDRDSQGELVPNTSDNSGTTFVTKTADESFTRAKEVLEGTANAIFYGDTRDVKSTKKKILTPAEKRERTVYEQELTNLKAAYDRGVYGTDEYLEYKKWIQEKIDGLGAYADSEKRFDIPLRYTQWKGMGWNIVGGISNALFGTTANLIEAAGGEFYTQSELANAYKKVFRHSFVRNATFNRAGGEEAIKIRSLMDRYTIMADAGSEYKSMVGGDITERMSWLSAYNMNARTEYVNQAPLMLVMFEKTPFEYNGETHMLYDGFNTDGTWNTEEFGEYPAELARKTTLKVKALVERNHGNYNPMSPILAKRTGLGRLIMQFRTWMVEGVRTRLGDKKGRYDEILEAEIKGRYISAYDIFREDWKGASLGLGLQIIRNFIPFGNKMFSNFTPVDKYIQGNSNVKPVDIANMKRLAMELNIFLGSLVVMLAAKGLAEGLDDDDPKKWGMNLLINQGTRLRTDVLMYINPLEAEKIIQDPIPSMKILTDIVKFQDAVHKTIIDGSPEYETGIYQGHNRIFRNTVNLIPGLSQGYRISSQGLQIYDDK